ncbi:MAG: Uma2 family endonuclease [Pseudanabaenaceae cyanobacterium]
MLNLPQDRPLPRAEDLPDSDETPVDNELQTEVPGLLREVLRRIWVERDDWFFAVNMGLYYHPDRPAIVPDAMLTVGVPRLKGVNGRLSYVIWEEGKFPDLVLEVVSQKYNGEYERKLQEYQDFGILYYVIYNPLVERRRHQGRSPLTVYRWTEAGYQSVPGNPVWLPELGLGIGYAEGTVGRWQRPWLYWYNEAGERYLPEEELRLQLARQNQREIWQRRTAELQAEQEAAQRRLAEALAAQAEEQRRLAEAQAAQAEEQRRLAATTLAKLRDRLQALGIDPDQLQP